MVPSFKSRNRFVNQSLKRKAVRALLKKGDWFGTSIQKTDFKLGPLFDTPCLLSANERSEFEEKVFYPSKIHWQFICPANNCWRRSRSTDRLSAALSSQQMSSVASLLLKIGLRGVQQMTLLRTSDILNLIQKHESFQYF